MDITLGVMLMTICTLANHMGLVEAVEDKLGIELPIINCCKCATFWSTLTYYITGGASILASLFVAFLLAYSAVWLELLLGLIDKLYGYLYEQIYGAAITEGDTNTESEGSPKS